MKHTAKQTTEQTLTAMYRAMDRHHPVTITTWKEEKDADGRKTGRMVQTIRTIETYDIVTTKAGNVTLKAMDRETGESRTFRLDRLISYTVHRTAYVIPREQPADAAPAPTTPAALIALELARDDRPTARRQLAPAA